MFGLRRGEALSGRLEAPARGRGWLSTGLQIKKLRYGRLKICATLSDKLEAPAKV
jgi:hypothetical protein